MTLIELEQKIAEATTGNAGLESKIKSIVASGESDFESKLIELAGSDQIVALIISQLIPMIKTYTSDILKAKFAFKMKSEGEVKIIFED